MIFDSDTHMSPYKNFDGAINAEELNDILAESNVSKAVVWLLPQDVDDVSESNRYIYDNAKKYSRFAVPFGWSNIREGEEKAIKDARICLEEYGFRGVKLNGAQNHYPIDCPPAMRVCEVIARNKGIIAFHIGSDEPDLTSARRAGNVAKAFPETTILMIHMGGTVEPDHSREVIEAAKIHSNMMLIGSAIDVSRVKTAIDELGPERVMYGSDIPFRDPKACAAMYEKMLEPYSREVRDLVMYENAKRVYGFSD